MLRDQQDDSVLVLDQAPCHNTVEFGRKVDQRGIRLVKIPKRFTGILSPPDTHWFAVFKRQYRAKWRHWFSHATHTYTVGGNLRSPSYATVIGWLSEIWEAFDVELIQRSFTECGIMSSDSPDPLHSALTKILAGVDVREYLEDVEEEQVDHGDEDYDENSSHNPDSDSSDDEYVLSSATTTTDESESDGDDGDENVEENGTSEIVDLLNKSNIEEDEFDQPVVAEEPLPAKNTRQLRSMGSDIF